MVELALERQAAIRAQAEVMGMSDQVRAEGVRVSGQVRDLVGSGWSGAAAEQYAAAWDDWQRGSEQLLGALDALAELMGAVRTEIEEADDDSAQAARVLVSRLGDVR
jgi:WXG100 family type VII secretion target